MKIGVLVPARSGSKSLPNKNIKEYHGHPLLAHSIFVAQKSKYQPDIYVSTDSEEYASIASSYGANVILRPSHISQDLSTDFKVFDHFQNELKEKKYDILIHLRPTYPNRSTELLDDCIDTFIEKYEEYDSLRTVVKCDLLPYKMYHLENQDLKPIFAEWNGYKEPYNQCRQIFPETYVHNGCIDIVKMETINEKKSMTGDKIYGYVMKEDEMDDIDTLADFYKSRDRKRE